MMGLLRFILVTVLMLLFGRSLRDKPLPTVTPSASTTSRSTTRRLGGKIIPPPLSNILCSEFASKFALPSPFLAVLCF